MTMGRGLVRESDGLLAWHGGSRYEDPGETVKTWWAGVLRIGCAESVWGNHSSSPCGKTAKHDPDAKGNPTRCGLHSVAAKAKKKSAAAARNAARRTKWDNQAALTKAEKEIEVALRFIATGHNDPRALAQGVLAELDAARDAVKGAS